MARHNEMTPYAFNSRMRAYIKKLLTDPLKADTDEFLKSHGIDGPKALSILTKRTDPNDENSAIVIKKATIKDNGFDDNGKRLKDTFTVKYKAPRKNFDKKMRDLYISLFESNIVDGCPINEDGATSAEASGQFVQPLFGEPIRKKTVYITQEQSDYLKKVINEEEGNCPVQSHIGGFGYTAPIGDGKNNKGNDFYKEANDHQDMMKKSWKGAMEESSIHIKKENEGKFTETKKRTGKSTEELTHSKNPLTRKRANFAKMAKRGWKPLKNE